MGLTFGSAVGLTLDEDSATGDDVDGDDDDDDDEPKHDESDDDWMGMSCL